MQIKWEKQIEFTLPLTTMCPNTPPTPLHEHEHEHVDEPKHASPPTKSVKCLSMETPPRSVTMTMTMAMAMPTTPDNVDDFFRRHLIEK